MEALELGNGGIAQEGMSYAGGIALSSLVEMCIDAACKSKESVQAWRRQTRTLERLPSHLAQPLFHRLLHSGLLNPPLLELFQYSMEEVIVSGDGSINAEWTAYFRNFKCLRVFKAANCRSLSNFALSHLKGLDTLQELKLSCCPKITDDGLSHLQFLTSLKKLALSETKVTAKGIESLSILKGLTSLDLGGLPVIDSNLRSLTTLSRLQNLDIWGSRVSDHGVLHLREFPSLQHINLAWTEVTRVPPLHSLKHLNMANCTIVSIFEGRKGFEGHLEVLNLSGTNIVGPLEILTGLGASKLSVLDLSSSNFKNFKVLCGLRMVERLDLSGTMVDDTAMDTIASIGVNLKHLDLSGCRITSGGVGVFAGFVPRLQQLVLSGTVVDDSVFAFLHLMPSLKMIDLSYTTVKGSSMEEKGRVSEKLTFAAMKGLSSLRILNLRNCPISDNSCLELLCLSELTHLDLRSELLSNCSLQSFSLLKKLVSLSIEGAMLTDSGLLEFIPPPPLKVLSLLDCWLLTKQGLSQFSKAHKDVCIRHALIPSVSGSSKSSPSRESRTKGSPYSKDIQISNVKSSLGSSARSIRLQQNKEGSARFSDERIKFSRSALLELRDGGQTCQPSVHATFDDLPPLLSTIEELDGLFKAGSIVES